MILWILVSAITASCPSECGTCTDLNEAGMYDLQRVKWISWWAAVLVKLNYAPNICNKMDLVGQIDGLTEKRVNDDWNCVLATCGGESIAGKWRTGEWTPCSKNCAEGEVETGKRSREVTCIDQNGETGQNVVCDPAAKPPRKQICNENCVVAEWKYSSWGACKEDTDRPGQCQKQRSVQCIDNKMNPAETCNYKKKPASRLFCSCPDMTDSKHEIDLIRDWNMENSKTSYYYDVPPDTIIVRRGFSFYIWLASSREIALSDIKISVSLIKNPSTNVETTVSSYFRNYWSWVPCQRCDNPSNQGWVKFELPCDRENVQGNAGVGMFKMTFTVHDHTFQSFYSIVLFNAYSQKCPEYMDSVTDIIEYVENPLGLIWFGSSGTDGAGNSNNQASVYDFKFNKYFILEMALESLKRLGYDHRRDIVTVARQTTYAVGNDYCYGRWKEPYEEAVINGGYDCKETGDCKKPGFWSDSETFFNMYKKHNSPVQFCQCFVFGMVMNTVGRGLGIPTRVISNFQSAHDYERNRAIEKFYYHNKTTGYYINEDDERGTSTDSIWNFHVWNEMYFSRKDLADADGWQVVDATPQEASPGGNPACTHQNCMQLGPVSIKRMKENENRQFPGDLAWMTLDHDFIIGEVNANIHMWVRDNKAEDWKLKKIYDTDPFRWENAVGQEMSTKRPGPFSQQCFSSNRCNNNYDRMYRNPDYKYEEPSNPGKPTLDWKIVEEGRMWGNGIPTVRGRRLEAKKHDYIEVQWLPSRGKILANNDKNTIIYYGGDFSELEVSIRVASYEDKIIDFYANFEATVRSYTGVDSIKAKVFEVHRVLNPGDETMIHFKVPFDAYKDVVYNSNLDVQFVEIEVFVSALERETREQLLTVQRFESTVPVCIPQKYYKNKVKCVKGDMWEKPLSVLPFSCENAPDQESLGDGFCDKENNFEGCWDHGDCCHSTCGKHSFEASLKDKQGCSMDKFECRDPRSTDHGYDVCANPSGFLAEANKAPCTSKTPTFNCNMHTVDACYSTLYALEEKYGEIKNCWKDVKDALLPDVLFAVEFLISCMKLPEEWTPKDRLKPKECKEVVFKVSPLFYGEEISWDIEGHDCSGGNYVMNEISAKTCCLEDGIYTINCHDTHGDGWHGAFVEVEGRKVCDKFQSGKTYTEEFEIGDTKHEVRAIEMCKCDISKGVLNHFGEEYCYLETAPCLTIDGYQWPAGTNTIYCKHDGTDQVWCPKTCNSDVKGWNDGDRSENGPFTCKYYAEKGWCKDCKAGPNWKPIWGDITQWGVLDSCCTSCGCADKTPTRRPIVHKQICTAGSKDTPNWRDSDPMGPFTCKDYKEKKWCKNCSAGPGWGKWGGINEFGALENCCESCGCTTLSDMTAITTTVTTTTDEPRERSPTKKAEIFVTKTPNSEVFCRLNVANTCATQECAFEYVSDNCNFMSRGVVGGDACKVQCKSRPELSAVWRCDPDPETAYGHIWYRLTDAVECPIITTTTQAVESNEPTDKPKQVGDTWKAPEKEETGKETVEDSKSIMDNVMIADESLEENNTLRNIAIGFSVVALLGAGFLAYRGCKRSSSGYGTVREQNPLTLN